MAPNTIYGGNPDVTPFLQTGLRAPALNERGWKDTHVVMPGEVTTFIVRFAPTDLPINSPASDLVYPFDPSLGPGYVWHCHIIDHEDNEMMRPYKVQRGAGLKTLNGAFAKAGNGINSNTTAAVAENKTERIGSVVLGQNYPNPFSGETEILFNLPEEAHVSLVLYNSAGTKIKTLIDSDAPAGVNSVRLDAEGLTEGVYLYELRTGFVSLVKRLVVQK